MATTLKLEKRTQGGKGSARRLRTEGLIPGVVYGAGKEATPVSVNTHDLMMIVKQGGFYSHVITADIDGKKEQVLPRELQRDPVKGHYLHLDLLRVNLKKKITVNVPVHFVGEDEAPGIKEGGMLQVVRNEVEVSCLANNIPEGFEVSVAGLGIGDNVRFSDISLPAGVELTDEEDRTLASVAGVRAEVEETDEAEAGAVEASAEEDEASSTDAE